MKNIKTSKRFNYNMFYKLLITYTLSTIFSFFVVNLISKYVNINIYTNLIISIDIGILSFITFYIVNKKVNTKKLEKINNFFKMHFIDLLYLFISSCLFLLSIKHYDVLNDNKFEKMISYSWTIIGLSITIFIFGYVLIDSYLGGTKPKKTNQKLDINNYYDIENYMLENDKYVKKINEMNFPITMLLINAILNIISTAFLAFSNDLAISYKKIIVILSLILSANTFICLITNICMPFIKEKAKANRDKLILDNDLNKMYIKILKVKEKENINEFLNKKIKETNLIIEKINNNLDITSDLLEIDIKKIINILNNYTKYFKIEEVKNDDLNKLKSNLKFIMEYLS